MIKKILTSVCCILCLTALVFAADPAYTSYQDNTNRFLMDLPGDFMRRPAPRPEVKVVALHPQNRVCIEVVADPVKGEITKKNRAAVIKYWADKEVYQLRKDPSNTHIDSDMTSIGGHEAAYVKYIASFTIGGKKIPLYVERYMIESNNNYYLINNSCDAAAEGTYRNIFNHCVQSFFTY